MRLCRATNGRLFEAVAKRIHAVLRAKQEFCESLKHIESVLFKAKMIKKRDDAKKKAIREYNQEARRAPVESEQAVPKPSLGSLMSQIRAKNDAKEETKKKTKSSWRRFEEEKERTELTQEGKIRFDEFEFQDNAEKNNNKKILTQDLDTLDDDNELTLLRKRKLFQELSGKRSN